MTCRSHEISLCPYAFLRLCVCVCVCVCSPLPRDQISLLFLLSSTLSFMVVWFVAHNVCVCVWLSVGSCSLHYH